MTHITRLSYSLSTCSDNLFFHLNNQKQIVKKIVVYVLNIFLTLSHAFLSLFNQKNSGIISNKLSSPKIREQALNNDILRFVFTFLDIKERGGIKPVCRKWEILANQQKHVLINDVLLTIFTFLDTKESACISTVCRQWKLMESLSSESRSRKNFQMGLETVRPHLAYCLSYAEGRQCGFYNAAILLNPEGRVIGLTSKDNEPKWFVNHQPAKYYSFCVQFHPFNWRGLETGEAFKKRSDIPDDFYDTLPHKHFKCFKEIYLKEMNQLARQAWKIAIQERVADHPFGQAWFQVLTKKTREELLKA